MLVESGFFDDFGDEETTEALIPYYLSDEQKNKLIDRYEKLGTPYVVQTDPMDQPDPGDVMHPPRTRRQIVRDVMNTADTLQKNRAEKSRERSSAPDLDEFIPDPNEKTLPLSRIKRMSNAESTLPTGMLSDYEDYSDPVGQDAQLSRMSNSDLDDEAMDDEYPDYTFNFDKFQDENSMPYLADEATEERPRKKIREGESRGSLIRKKYYGRY